MAKGHWEGVLKNYFSSSGIPAKCGKWCEAGGGGAIICLYQTQESRTPSNRPSLALKTQDHRLDLDIAQSIETNSSLASKASSKKKEAELPCTMKERRNGEWGWGLGASNNHCII